MKTSKKKILILILFLIGLTAFKNFETIEDLQQFATKCDDKDIIQGLYILQTCENGRFKISINKKGALYIYNILDREKSISKGKIIILKEDNTIYLTFGKIEGILQDDSIHIQNYGNSMNKYKHFTQCGDKYLIFKKK